MNQRNEKLSGDQIVIKNRFLQWLDNFWYHNKWTIIAVAFFLIVCIVCFGQCAERENGDITLVYAGSSTITAEQHKNIVSVFDAVAPQNKSDEKKLTTLLTAYSVYTEEEMMAACTDEDGTFSPSAYANFKQVTQDHLKTFGNYVMTGESGI